MRRLRIGMAQINTTVGDFKGNTQKIMEAVTQARSLEVDLLTFPELAICGYPPEDLLFKPQFIEENLKSLERVINGSSGLTIVVGFVDKKDDIYNAAAVIHDGKLRGVYHKIYLPNYGVFDEHRYFRAGNECPVYIIAGVGVGITICEDIWHEAGPATAQAYTGAEVIVNISASPYHFSKGNVRERMLAARASDNIVILAYNNLVGAQDELVFDGNSMIMDEKGQLIARGKQFEEDLIVADLDVESVLRTRRNDPGWKKGAPLLEEQGWHKTKLVVTEAASASPKPPLPERQLQVRSLPEEVYDALVLGTRDYVLKNDFKKVLIGLSGGIDSSLVAAIAVDALVSSNVVGVAMPSRYYSPGSISDAKLLSHHLAIRLLTIRLDKAFQSLLPLLVKT